MSILTQGGAAGGGSTTDLASPGAIGGTTPAAITGTTITATTKLVAPAGTVSAPSVSVAASGSGLFSIATNQVSMAVNGTEVMRWGTGSQTISQSDLIIVTGQKLCVGTSSDASLTKGATTNAIIFGPSTSSSGAAVTRAEINKAVTAIADNTATATFTVTIPNGAHSASLKVTLVGSLGAGGAIGANEASATAAYDIAIARTAGVNAVAVASTVYGMATASVAGASVVTVTAAVSAISGAVGATNTFTVNVTIARTTGSSTNHTCFAYGVLLNANASGVTIA